MKKSANLVDKALDVARKARSVPKKPVKTKGKKTVPETLDWGPGIPLDKLAYLNDDEMALVQAKRMFKGKRKYKGVPAFPDPGDTAAGDRGRGTSSSAGLGNNTSSGSTYGGGGGRDSGAGGAGGMGSYGGGSGGSTEGSRQGGGGGTSGMGGGTSAAAGSGVGAGTGAGSDSGSAASSSGTTSTSAGSSSQSKSSGPTSGQMSQPARTEASSYSAPSGAAPSAATPPTGYSSFGGYNPVTSAPSTMASEAALNRIASGSSVIGNTTPQGYATPKIQDRVAPVSYDQTPSGPVDTTGANSPFADPEVGSYYADRPSLAGAVSQYSQYRSPPAPTTAAFTNAQNAMYTAEDAANFGDDGALPRGGGYMTTQDPTPTRSMAGSSIQANPNESVVGKAASSPHIVAGPNQGLGYTPAAPGVYSNVPASTPVNAPKQYGDRLVSANGTTYSVSPQQMAGLSPENQQALADYNQAVEYNPAGVSQQLQSSYNPLSSITPPAQTGALVSSGPPSATRGLPAPAAPSATKNVFYSSPAEQAADVRRAVALAQGAASPPMEVDIPGGDIPTGVVPPGSTTVPAGEYDYNPAQDPQNYMQPVYPGEEGGPYYMTDDQRTAYLNSVSGTRSSERPLYTPKKKEERAEVQEKKRRKKPPRQRDDRYVYRDYVSNDYENIGARPNQRIVDFNRYNQQTFKEGGKVNDSVQSALRIAKSKLL